MKHIYLIGDSIIDNAPYVKQGHTVTDYLTHKTIDLANVTKLALDGDITTGAINQLSKVSSKCDHLIISVGGNDALQSAHHLYACVNNIAEGLEHLAAVLKEFKSNYNKVLQKALSVCPNITIATIYNNVPGLGIAEKTALALFNETILELAIMHAVKIIDLRVICNQESDYSVTSPIEPSETGGDKISQAIVNAVFNTDDSCFTLKHSTQVVYG